MARGIRTKFTPTNPEKYDGAFPIVAKSSWELEFMRYCDNHPDVLKWAYEPVKIPYNNPIKANKTQSIYLPDFLITVIQKGGNTITKLIEIKPLHEADQGFVRNSNDSVTKMQNDAKWAAAQAWAMRRGIEFDVMTEADLFAGGANKKARSNPVRAAIPATVKDLKPKVYKKRGKKTKLSASKRSSTSSRLSKVRTRKSAKAGKTAKARRR